MSLWRLIIREIIYRPGSCWLGLCAVVMAVATVSGTLTVLDLHATQSRSLLDQKEAETRERMALLRAVVATAMDRLGFNITLLPEGQDLGDWHAQDYAAKTFNPASVQRLKQAPLVTIAHPIAQFRQRLKWPETKWTVILVGTEGRIPGDSKPLAVVPIPRGHVWVGHEIHRGLGINEKARLSILGREFRVDKCLNEEGSQDDITLWMNLAAAQELLDKPDQINEIVAVETRPAWANPDKVREETSRLIPGVRVVENTSKVAAAVRARLNAEKETQAAIDQERQTQIHLSRERGHLAGILNAVVLIVCAAWLGWLAFSNAADRYTEIGIWLALGIPLRYVVFLFWAKWLFLGMIGGMLGFLSGVFLGVCGSMMSEDGGEILQAVMVSKGLNLKVLWWALATAVGLAATSLIPVSMALRKDPAVILREQ